VKKALKNLLYTVIVVIICIVSDILIACWLNIAHPGWQNLPVEIEKYAWYYIIFIGPILEELWFRGVCVMLFFYFLKSTAITDKRGEIILRWILIIISGVYFGIEHYSNGGFYSFIPGIVAISIRGMVWAWLALKTKNLAWPILAHMMNNAFAYYF